MTRNLSLTLTFSVFALCVFSEERTVSGGDAEQQMPGSRSHWYNNFSTVPSFIVMSPGAEINVENAFTRAASLLKISSDDQLQLIRVEEDHLGYQHYRYQQYHKGYKVKDGIYILHSRNGQVVSMNGFFIENIQAAGTPGIPETAALQKALEYIGADSYKWQVESEENFIKMVKKDASASYFPKATLEYIAVKGDYTKRDMRLAYRFDIYAHEPMSRRWIFVDAVSGDIIYELDRICHADVNGTANTRYSGTQNIVADQTGPSAYRLRETGRGLGVETYDLNNGTNYGNAVDFTDTDNNWTTTTNMDDAAFDAHWGAESTYDYYVQIHNRNGLDNNGMLMRSYVHYSTNYNNAFWNGSEMTYGDGSNAPGGFTPLTAIDVCGHEFTHGVTEFSSNLDYSYESGALNESFSDIFGTTIEFWKKPSDCDWLIGSEIVYTQPGALRSMSNPNAYGDPDCYQGTNWYTGSADNGGVHTNSGVQNFWYYLLTTGGTGTNEVGDNYNVTGIGMNDARQIAYRNNAVYLVSTSQYADARTFAIQSAQDLFGSCSQQHISTTNAWFACNVGNAWTTPTVTSAFSASTTTSCTVPVTINFSNTSQNANQASWDFGDSGTSNSWTPSHTYTAPGVYTVQLSVTGGCGSSATTQTSYINVNPPAAPLTTGAVSCTSPASVTLNATGSGTMVWYTVPTAGTPVNSGTSYTTPSLSSTTTYYVENQVSQPNGNVGPLNNTFGGGGNHNSGTPQYEIFNVLQPCTLLSAYVYSSTAGNRTITLWDNAGNVINTYVVNIPNGNSTVNLNIPLNPGTGYRLGGTNMNLYRNNAGATYPYTLSGLVSITGASAGGGYYYYFYDWTIAPQPCTSPRTPVTAIIGGPNVTFAPLSTVCSTAPAFVLTGGTPSGGTYSGPGVSSGQFNPAAAGIGTHTITYTYTDTNNCSGTATQTITVNSCLGLNEAGEVAAWNFYPNPNNGFIQMDLQLNTETTIALSLFNAIGQTVLGEVHELVKGMNHLGWDVSAVPAGIYLLSIATPTGVTTRRVEIVR
ncbi:MAG: M4 family metallopeptidase [Bacteroidia bacterium]|nr:M4 family metallopeptidase [Bacteroidia bacterium]